MNATPIPRRKVGRPARSTVGPQRKKTLNFAPEEIAHLEATYGTVQAGVRELVRRDRERATKR